MFNVGIPELILILVVVLIVFGPGKLPEVGRAMGKGLGEFRRAMNTDGKSDVIDVKPVEARKDDKEAEGQKTETK